MEINWIETSIRHALQTKLFVNYWINLQGLDLFMAGKTERLRSSQEKKAVCSERI